jgi:UDP-2-acetamido-2-deoxy-ribo-hexuluronate aminotransferase
VQLIDLKRQYEALRHPINQRIQSILDHGQYVMGPEVDELERALSHFVGIENCTTVASGTEALLISLMALELDRGAEVITTPFTFAATAEVIALLGFKPVFVDIEPGTCNIDARLIESKITPKTRAIIPVSIFGQPADMDDINAIAENNGLFVIEDAAQSFGAEYKGRRSCGLSKIGCTSFFPSKPLGCYGDGGAIFTNDEILAKKMREIRVHGQSSRYFHSRVGVGGRMDTLQCGIVLEKLRQFPSEISARMAIGNRYNQMLRDKTKTVRPLIQKPDRSSVYAQYTILAAERDSLREHLLRSGIPVAVHYPRPLNEQPAYQDLCCSGCTPIAAEASRSVLSLPMHPYLSLEEQDQVVDAILNFDKVA